MAFSKARRLSDFIAADGTVPATKFATGTITSAMIADTSITATDLHSTLDLTGKTVTVATAGINDNDTSVASTAFVQSNLAALVDSSPASLDTLNELAAALGDDVNFSTTVTDSIALKLPLAGGALTGALTTNSTIDGRNVSTDGTKLDTVETNADITDTANVTSAGALMDSELTGIASVKALNQGVATTDDPTFANTKLAAISKDISDTAVDVFVYDTRKDSDGGAWRKRTQNTSWYNEASGSNRSSRKEFPSVAVLAFNTSQELFIYDGDDPELSLWAKYTNFTQDSGGYASVTAKNGSIYAAQASAVEGYSGNGYFQLNFVADYFFSNIGSVFSTHKQGRANELLTSHNYKPRGDRTTPLYPLTAYQIGEIAVAVLPNAPIDSDTGLPKVTLALAGGKPGGGQTHGLSIITDDGNVVDLTASTGAGGYGSVAVSFNSLGHLVYDQSYNGGYPNFYVRKNIPTADQQMQVGAVTYSGTTNSGGISIDGNPAAGSGNFTGSRALTFTGKDSFAVGFKDNSQKLSQVYFVGDNDFDSTAAVNGTVVYTTSSYNTGHMVGDIKLATLSDTDTTSVTSGSDLITNGNFTSGTTGWVASQSTVSGGSNKLTLTPNSGVNGGIYQGITTVIGKSYVARVKVLADTGSLSRLIAAVSTNINDITSTNLGAKMNMGASTHDINFVATATTTYIWLVVGGGTQQATEFDDARSYLLVEEDRSVNNNSLQVLGTITKTPVATGADLVAYGGFSSSNYLIQPYNSDLDFTGDFCWNLWYYHVVVPQGEYMAFRAPHDNGTPKTEIFVGTNNTLGIYVNDLGAIYTPAVSVNTWHHLVGVRLNGILRLYLNGKEVASGASTVDLTNTNALLAIGVRTTGGYNGINGKLALFRVSATAPTSEQIEKMYNDEKQLFQENAKATLYGSSDAVTALAYDDDTELLHVGTSAGRSDFQGLRRVNNTTRAIGTAISAVDGFIVEE